MLVIASDAHQSHDTVELSRGKLARSVECPRRVEIITRALQEHGHQFIAPEQFDKELIEQVHTVEYVEFLSTVWERWQAIYGSDVPAMAFAWPSRGDQPRRPDNVVGQLGYHSFGADCAIVSGTWQAAANGAAIAQTATDRVLNGEFASYALCRPPGHHATADQFGGYCFLNNSAIAAQRFLNSGVSQVAVLDVDYHHGNGTQAIFYQRSDVLTISIHADPMLEFPYFSGHASETGDGIGRGANLNLPLPPGTNYQQWSRALDSALEQISAVNVQAVVVALGVDSYVDDPLGTFTIETNDYTNIAARIANLNLPTVIVQEGGYAVDAIGDNVAAFLKAFS